MLVDPLFQFMPVQVQRHLHGPDRILARFAGIADRDDCRLTGLGDIQLGRLVHRHFSGHRLRETFAGEIGDFTADEIARIALIVGRDLTGACRDRHQVGRILQTHKGCRSRIAAHRAEPQPADERTEACADERGGDQFRSHKA
ncbi:hypothetical protein [Mycobacterium sp. GA-2829]|uniref:hypothetical protein n=1 Tax=Mycobacterium sp. GA-2829 TaxID=1772283 RepID=UPI001E4EA36D|nr:hypothetical protein [Mycobacterium sp. GA-2829]